MPNESFSFPNQIKVVIDKPDMEDLDYFGYYDQEALWEAMNILSGTEFKVYIRLLANAPNVEWKISRVDVMNKTGISAKSYQRAMDRLEELGYLEKGKAFHMYPNVKGQFDYSHNDQEDMVILYEDIENHRQNDYRNNINTGFNKTTSNNIKNFPNASIGKVEKPKGKGNEYSRPPMDYEF